VRLSNGRGAFRHRRQEISLSKSAPPGRLRVSTLTESLMNDDLTRDSGPLGGMLCVFLALVILLII
jgi:hypothetical protein